MENTLIKINESDNVAIAYDDMKAGTVSLGITLLQDIPKGHKAALCDIAEGENIVKYGFPIGHATSDIKKGKHIHSHNMKTNLSGILEYAYQPELAELAPEEAKTFLGYERKDGSAGIRNEVWIIPTVGCINNTAKLLAERANREFAERCDGVHTFVHPFGCSQLGEDQGMTQKILRGLVRHPNAGAVLVLGLGCENNNIEEFKKVLGETDPERVKFMSAQDFDDELEQGMAVLDELTQYASQFKRTPISMNRLIVGLKCGGSDAFSGITANPLVGRFSDKLTREGGTTLLSEVPEMFGAEHLLMNRAVDQDVFERTVSMINNFKGYFMKYKQPIYENPSPGNKAGGITTLEEKSLGCTQKGGTGNVVDVLEYGDEVKKAGLNLLTGPGNDIVASTVLTAAGAHMILFTTGRGTPLGAPVPTMKISTNSALYQRKPHWIDFNAGSVLEGVSMDEACSALYEKVRAVASGEQTNNEKNNYREIAIFKDGVTL
jgi:altronate hydrolase